MGIDESLFSVDQAEEIKTQNNLHIVPNATDSLLNKGGKATQRKIFNNLSDGNEDVFFELFDEKGNPLMGTESVEEIDEETDEETAEGKKPRLEPGDRYHNDTLELGKKLYIVDESEVRIK